MSGRYSISVRNAMAQALLSAIDAGGAAGSAQAWNGAEPAAVGDAPAGSLMASCTLAYPCGGVSDGNLLLFETVADAAVDIGGTPTFLRFLTSAGVVVAIRPVVLASTYDALSADEQTALGEVVRLSAELTVGQPVNLAGTLAFVMPGE